MSKDMMAPTLEELDEELINFVTFRVSQTHAKLNAQAAHILRQRGGLSLVEWRIIALVQAYGPNVSAGAIIEKCGMDKGMFSRTLKRVTQQGFVRSSPDKYDHRKISLSVTREGREIFDRLIVVMRQRQKHLLHNLSAEKKAILYEALDILSENADRKDF